MRRTGHAARRRRYRQRQRDYRQRQRDGVGVARVPYTSAVIGFLVERDGSEREASDR
jgi:hypothetical protein